MIDSIVSITSAFCCRLGGFDCFSPSSLEAPSLLGFPRSFAFATGWFAFGQDIFFDSVPRPGDEWTIYRYVLLYCLFKNKVDCLFPALTSSLNEVHLTTIATLRK